MSKLRENTNLLLLVLDRIPNPKGVRDVFIEGISQGIFFTWSDGQAGVQPTRLAVQYDQVYQIQVFEMVEDDRPQEEDAPPRQARRTATAAAYILQAYLNKFDGLVSQAAMPNPWPADLIKASGLVSAMRNDIERRLLSGESIDMLAVLDRLISLFETFDL